MSYKYNNAPLLLLLRNGAYKYGNESASKSEIDR